MKPQNQKMIIEIESDWIVKKKKKEKNLAEEEEEENRKHGYYI